MNNTIERIRKEKKEYKYKILTTHPNSQGIVTVFITGKGIVSPGSYNTNNDTLRSYIDKQYKGALAYKDIIQSLNNTEPMIK